jgi:hypothetical protein
LESFGLVLNKNRARNKKMNNDDVYLDDYEFCCGDPWCDLCGGRGAIQKRPQKVSGERQGRSSFVTLGDVIAAKMLRSK